MYLKSCPTKGRTHCPLSTSDKSISSSLSLEQSKNFGIKPNENCTSEHTFDCRSCAQSTTRTSWLRTRFAGTRSSKRSSESPSPSVVSHKRNANNTPSGKSLDGRKSTWWVCSFDKDTTKNLYIQSFIYLLTYMGVFDLVKTRAACADGFSDLCIFVSPSHLSNQW